MRTPELQVTIGTLVQYLFGSRLSALTLASRPDTLWLGLVFVISAAFAREYDSEDLFHEPRDSLCAGIGTCGIHRVVLVVMLFADTLAVSSMASFKLPFVGFMSGARKVEGDQVLVFISFLVTVLGILSWPFWLACTLTVMFGGWCDWKWAARLAPSPPMSRAVKMLAATLLLIWAFVLPWTQPEQQLRHAIGSGLRTGSILESRSRLTGTSQGLLSSVSDGVMTDHFHQLSIGFRKL